MDRSGSCVMAVGLGLVGVGNINKVRVGVKAWLDVTVC